MVLAAAAAADISAHRVRLDESRWLEKDLLYVRVEMWSSKFEIQY